jgi:hypothetical protein
LNLSNMYFKDIVANINLKSPCPIEKVYFTLYTFDVKLQADNLVRWDVVPLGLNHKQKN